MSGNLVELHEWGRYCSHLARDTAGHSVAPKNDVAKNVSNVIVKKPLERQRFFRTRTIKEETEKFVEV